MQWILLGLMTLLAPNPVPDADYTIDLSRPLVRGLAWQYRPGLMEQVANRRGIPLYRGTRDFVSVPSCIHVGDMVYARIGRTTAWWTVVDCSRKRDLPAQRRKRLIIEASGKRAIQDGWDHYVLDGPGHTGAEIYKYKEVRR